MAFEGGYTSALNSASTRDVQGAELQELLRRQQQEDKDRKLADAVGLDFVKSWKEYEKLLNQPQPMAPPPQSPMPGQGSVPMTMPPPMAGGAPPGPPQMGPPPAPPPQPGMGGSAAGMMGQAMQPPPGMGAGMAPPPGMPPPGAQPPAQPPMPPQGWKASPAAPAALGGPGGPPQPPQGGAAPGGIEPPPSGPGGAQQGQLPSQWLSIPKAIEAMDKAGVPPERQYATLSKMYPIITAQNKQALEELKEHVLLQKEITAFAHTKIEEMKEKRLAAEAAAGGKPTAGMKNKMFAAGGDEAEAQRLAHAQEEKKGQFAPARGRAAGGGGAGGAGASEALTPGGLKVAAELIKAGRPLPGGWSKAGQSRGNAILNQMAIDEEGGAGSGAISSGMAGYKADSGSLAFQQKRVDSIENSMKKIGKDVKTLESVLDKGAFSEARVLNVPINKLRRAMSDPDLAKLDLAAQLVGTEYERMMTGGLMSVAQLHEGAREDAKKLISGDLAPKEIRAKLPVMKQEMDNARNAANEQLAEIKGRMKKGSEASKYTETRKTADGRTLGKKADGTIEEVK